MIWRNPSTTRRIWLATFLFFNPLLNVLYVRFGRNHSQSNPVTGKKQEILLSGIIAIIILGFFIKFPGLTHLWMEPFSHGVPKDASLAIIEARNSFENICTSSCSDQTRFACRKIAIFCESDHSLITQIAQSLENSLAGLNEVDTVILYPKGSTLPQGEIKPDLFLRLDLKSIEEIPISYSHKLKTTISAYLGCQPWQKRNFSVDSNTLPILDFGYSMTLHHESTTNGYEAMPYQMAAQNIADQLQETLSKQFNKWEKEYGLLPILPNAMVGSYLPVELPVFLQELRAEKEGSYRSLLRHNETFWRFKQSGSVIGTLKHLADAARLQGWNVDSSSFTSGACSHTTLIKGLHYIQICPCFDSEPQSGDEVTKPSKTPLTYHIQSELRFNDKELQQAIQSLFRVKAPIEDLVLYFRKGSIQALCHPRLHGS
jgi:hypothetical protein